MGKLTQTKSDGRKIEAARRAALALPKSLTVVVRWTGRRYRAQVMGTAGRVSVSVHADARLSAENNCFAAAQALAEHCYMNCNRSVLLRDEDVRGWMKCYTISRIELSPSAQALLS